MNYRFQCGILLTSGVVIFFATVIYWILRLTINTGISEVSCQVVAQTSEVPKGIYYNLMYLNIAGIISCFEKHGGDSCPFYKGRVGEIVPCFTYSKGYYVNPPFAQREQAGCYYFGICDGLEIYALILGIITCIYICLVFTVLLLKFNLHWDDMGEYETLSGKTASCGSWLSYCGVDPGVRDDEDEDEDGDL